MFTRGVYSIDLIAKNVWLRNNFVTSSSSSVLHDVCLCLCLRGRKCWNKPNNHTSENANHRTRLTAIIHCHHFRKQLRQKLTTSVTYKSWTQIKRVGSQRAASDDAHIYASKITVTDRCWPLAFGEQLARQLHCTSRRGRRSLYMCETTISLCSECFRTLRYIVLKSFCMYV
jgi:hypothetical protein